MTNMKDSKFIIGNIGEMAIERLLEAQRSEDWYDSEKDGLIGDKNYEVKTIRLNDMTNGFWIGENHSKTMWKKVDGVKMLFFVKIPETEDELASVYLCLDHKNCWVKARTNSGEGVRSYPISECLRLFSLGKRESRILHEHSKKISTYRRKTSNVR